MKNVISGLLKKRKELLHDLAECEAGHEKAREALNAMDLTIRLYQPEIELPLSKPDRKRYKRSEYFKSREVTPTIQDYLREYSDDKPASTMDIVQALAAAKKIDYENL